MISLRTRKKNMTTADLPGSKIRKITIPSARKRATEIMLFKSVTNKPETKINSRIMQASVGRTLDSIKVFDKEKRSKVQSCMQKVAGRGLERAEIKELAKTIEKTLGKRDTAIFFNKLIQIQGRNSAIAGEAFNFFTSVEIVEKTRMN